MDLLNHLQVMARWKRVIIAGILVGVLIALAFTFRVSFDGGVKVGYRQAEEWKATSTLFVTQPGFPWGRTTLPSIDPNQTTAQQRSDQSFADPSRLSVLAVIYAFLAPSQPVDQIGGAAPPGTTVTAREISTPNGNPLPLLVIETTAPTSIQAKALNRERTLAMLRYLRDQQNQNEVPRGQRVQLKLLKGPEAAKVSSHGAMLAIAMVFLAALASLGAAYLFENLRLARAARAATKLPAAADREQPLPATWHGAERSAS